MITIRIRSVLWFANGTAIAVLLAAVFIGVRGYAAPGATESTFVPITPCRLFDYRPAPNTVGPRTSPIGPAEVVTQQVTGSVGNCNVPATASGVAMNVTIAGPTAQSNLRVYPANIASVPTVSSLNWLPGQSPTPNKVDVKLSPTGAVKLYNAAGSVYVLADVVGYYTHTGLANLQQQLDGLRTQTVEHSGWGMTPSEAGGYVKSFGCPYIASGRTASLPLNIPIGAKIEDVTATVFDVATVASYSMQLIKAITTPDGETITAVGFATGGSLTSVTTTHDLTPPSETVGKGERFTASWDSGAYSSANGLCDVSVTYRLPGG